MIQNALHWWLEVTPVRRWGIPLAFIAAAAVADLVFDHTWHFGWGMGVVLVGWVAIFRRREPG